MRHMRPLTGINVVSVEQAVAAPFASMRLADAGANVVKIERPEGDFARGYDDVVKGQSSYFVWLNRGKSSVTLDLGSEEGKSALAEAISQADVVVQNLKPGAMDRLGFGAKKLREEQPGLITCSISGYGEHGPLVSRKAYDLLVQAESGLCSITGSPDNMARVGVSLVDIATGITAYSAILEALLRRGITGEGAEINVAMFDVMAEWLTVPLLNHEGGKSPKRIGLAHPSIAPYGAFQPKDGPPILIAIQNDREWMELCKQFIGKPELGTDPRFATNVARVANRAETDAAVQKGFDRRTSEKAIAEIEQAGIAFAMANDMEGLSVHPHLRRITVDSPNGPVSFPAPAPEWVGEDQTYGAVPALKTLEE